MYINLDKFMSDNETNDPLDESLWGEYVRILIVGTAICSALCWSFQFAYTARSAAMVMVNIALLGIATSTRFAGLPRLAFLSLIGFSMTQVIDMTAGRFDWSIPHVFFSPVVTIACVLLLAVRDVVIIVKKSRGISLPTLIFGTMFLGAAIYMVVIPAIDACLEPYRDHPSSYTIEELNAFEILRIRTSKFAVFAVFAFAGASVGSFINVVAASAPRGEPIALRSSACPHCNTPIRRFDNLPIVSYLRLSGKCRTCDVKIPARYLLVELVGLLIFALLFLYELVTGAANVPGFRVYHHAGILWIILYTKWPVIGIYFFHCILFTCILMLSLMDLDRLRCPRWLSWSMLIAFVAFSVLVATLQPVAFYAQIPGDLSSVLPSWLVRLTTCMIGGCAGWILATMWARLAGLRKFPESSLGLAAAILGITLGWQATVTIGILFAAALVLERALQRRSIIRKQIPPTMMLFLVAMVHHPMWSWLAGFWPNQ